MEAKSAGTSALQADLGWNLLYRLGCLAALLYLLLAIVVPAGLVAGVDYDFELNGVELLSFIAEHRSWWIAVQGLVLGPSVFAIITYLALYVALRESDKSIAVIAVIVSVGAQLLFLAYFPVVSGLVYLSDQYAIADSPVQRAALAGGAEALVAMNNAYGFSDTLSAFGILLYSVLLLKAGRHQALAYLGMLTFVAAVVGAVLKPLVGAAYLWWWALFVLWFIGVMYMLYTYGWGHDNGETET